MKEIPLSMAPAALVDLVCEVERTGETIVLTRDGHPAATLEPVRRAPAADKARAALSDLASLRDKLVSNGVMRWPSGWDELKTWAEDGRG